MPQYKAPSAEDYRLSDEDASSSEDHAVDSKSLENEESEETDSDEASDSPAPVVLQKEAPQDIPDPSTYRQLVNLTLCLSLLPLLRENVTQLRSMLDWDDHPYFQFTIILISISITLQVFFGVELVQNTRRDSTVSSDTHHAEKPNDFILIAAFLIFTINVFIAVFM